MRTVCDVDAHSAAVEGLVLEAGHGAEVSGRRHLQVEAAWQLLDGAPGWDIPLGLPHAARQRHVSD